MRIKKLLVLAGVVALLGLLWATPASADAHLPTITLDPASVPAEAGDVTLTVSGANWTEPSPFFIVACPGAAGDPEAPLTLSSAPEAIAMCPNLMAAVVPVTWDDGSFTTEWTTTITQADIDAGGLVIMAGWLSVDTLSSPEEFATVALLAIGVEEPAAEEPAAEEPMEEEPMEEESMEEEPMEEEPMEEAADEEPMEEEPMAEEEPMEEEPMAEEELPETGAESGLLVVVGASILVAGLLAIGAGRRVRTVTR